MGSEDGRRDGESGPPVEIAPQKVRGLLSHRALEVGAARVLDRLGEDDSRETSPEDAEIADVVRPRRIHLEGA